jgi:hypothetical protein
MLKDAIFPWFNNVHTIKCYKVYEMKEIDICGEWLTAFRKLVHFRGITEE